MNIAQRIRQRALEHPTRKAVVFPQRCKGGYQYESLSFFELEHLSNHYAQGLKDLGLGPHDKILLFVRPCLDFPALVFALFKLGAIPVMIDPGMGRKNLLRAIAQVKPKGLIAVPEIHLARLVFPHSFSSLTHFITTGKLCWGKMVSLQKLKKGHSPQQKIDFNIFQMNENELAAILFTSGGTGIPKGVEYTHKIFNSQTDILQQLFNLGTSDIDLPGFPLFSLFTVAMGMQSCIPDMNPSKPAKVNPRRIVQNILDNKASFAAGSPAIWTRVGDYCQRQGITLPSLKHLVMFGAPIPAQLHQQFASILPNGNTFTPYGATESLPVANISGDFLLSKTLEKTRQGAGTCVGKPVCNLKIINIGADHIEELPPLEIGEIVVNGDVVTKTYHLMPEETQKAKIYQDNMCWHRIGDLGYLDNDNYLWFCGRKAHSVHYNGKLRCSIPVEAIFNAHPLVKRTALIGFNNKKIALAVELTDGTIPKGNKKKQLIAQLIELGKAYPHTHDIEQFFFHRNFPVDVRHNIKIDRLQLRDHFLEAP